MKAKTICLLALVGLAFGLGSCTKDDGDWGPMEWSGYGRNVVVSVPAEGGTTYLHCKNYSGVWISDVTEEAGGKTEQYYEDSTNTVNHFTTKWAEVTSSNSTVSVTVKPNTTGMERTLTVMTTLGDVFSPLKFVQSAK